MSIGQRLIKDHLTEFKTYLDERGISHREGKGDTQVLQIASVDGDGWGCMYERKDSPDHYTIQEKVQSIVISFYIDRREKSDVGKQANEKIIYDFPAGFRKVKVYKWGKTEDNTFGEKVPGYIAIFHAWGYKELENGTGNFSTAIIEKVDGSVDNIPVELIVFID